MPDWKNLINMCVLKPSYQLMEIAYNDYRVDSGPCKRGVTNQCAVRMSVALGRCGFDLVGFPNRARVHTLFERCRVPVEHVLGANELATYLTQCWGQPERFRGRQAATAAESIADRRGIVYFDNCFRREAGGPKTGDHIDLWDGRRYYNLIIHVGAGGDAGADTPLFREAGEVWFYPLAA